MTIWVLSDLHLSFGSEKPMDVFGAEWQNHSEKIERNWKATVAPEDTVLVPGDISWAMQFEQALPDLVWLSGLPGRKILSRGNHDYWWKKIQWLRQNLPDTLYPLQNDSIQIEGRTICGCRGWSTPIPDTDTYEQDAKIFEREKLRLIMSLESAKGAENPIVMMHFPPFGYDPAGDGFTEIIERYGVKIVVYGHLHGEDVNWAFSGERNGVQYIFASCDGVDFTPIKVG